MDLERWLADRLAPGFAKVVGGPVDPAVRRSQHADFQSDAALSLARRLGRSPRDIAAEVVAHAELTDVDTTLSGPGFINLTVGDATLGALVSELATDERLGVTAPATVETVVVDYSAPNVAKEMHVGHLRTTVIGDAVVRLLDWLGHRVIRANHLGDWGTPFGMLVEHLRDVGETDGDLDAFYKVARARFEADDAFKERARRRVVALQSGDEDTMRLWRRLVELSKEHFLAVYDRLDTRLTDADFVGESFYNDALGPVVEELDGLGLLRDSDGAACAFPAGFAGRDGEPLPLIVRKSDGGYGYAATDLAAIRHRLLDEKATRLLYVVGLPQRQHLEMVFQVAREAGWLRPPARAEHIGFGSILGTDGKMLRSRAGDSIKLADLLAEAVDRAAGLSPDRDIATAVGIGAVKYADLSTDRAKDYIFDWDRMLALSGNTAPYLQYAHARVRSIFAKAGSEPGSRVIIAEPAEHTLAIALLGFAPAIAVVERTLEFHRLAGYLYDLATAFNGFFRDCPVLKAEPEIRASRLALCDLTARTLRHGLGILGITTPDRM